jgi:SpoVK/Ycf46/Vps4 family AAA+-type ATPase
MVCRALARECGARMLQIRPSDIMNKWFGNSENLARNVFVRMLSFPYFFLVS